MKIAVVFALFFVSFAYSAPVEENDCLSLYSNKLCTAYDSLEKDIDKYAYGGYNNIDFLTNALRAKLDFLVSWGLLNKIPLVGDKLHEFVSNNQDLIIGVLNGGISSLMRLVPKLLLFAG